MTTVQVEAAVVGRKRAGATAHGLAIDLPPGPTSLRVLIEAIVTTELAAAKARTEQGRVVRVLTDLDIREGLAAGAVRSGERESPPLPDRPEAVHTALEAYQDGLYQVFVSEEAVDNLDDMIQLGDGMSILFVRLVPLAGG